MHTWLTRGRKEDRQWPASAFGNYKLTIVAWAPFSEHHPPGSILLPYVIIPNVFRILLSYSFALWWCVGLLLIKKECHPTACREEAAKNKQSFDASDSEKNSSTNPSKDVMGRLPAAVLWACHRHKAWGSNDPVSFAAIFLKKILKHLRDSTLCLSRWDSQPS